MATSRHIDARCPANRPSGMLYGASHSARLGASKEGVSNGDRTRNPRSHSPVLSWRVTAPAGSVSRWGYVRKGRNRQKLGPKEKCSFDGCFNPREYANGLCDGHWQQLGDSGVLKPLFHKRAARVPTPHPTIAGAVQVPLTRGQFAVADADMADLLVAFKWVANTSGYATTQWGFDERSSIQMHRFLWERWGLPDTPQLDHVNLDRLDNRRSNLRAATATQNLWNRPVTARNRSGFKGVSFRKDNGLWRARIRQFGKLIDLGQFDTPEAAHAAYASAAKAMRGEFARAA